MKTIFHLLWILCSVGLLISCQELTPLSPPDPIVGKWRLYNWQTFHVPAWYVAKTNMPYILTPTDTIFAGPSPTEFDVTLLNFNSDGSFTESYLLNGGFTELSTTRIDAGSWILVDSVVTLKVANTLPHKLTYRVATGELSTDIYPKTAVQRLLDSSVHIIQYSIRVKYRKDL